tara:strand:- start:132 stop:2513 length:2382 start_codon:yes stop_codon:yes gene_type:complete
MPKSAPALSSFTGGELSPKLEGRVGLQKYSEGLSDLTNFLVLPQGGVTRRPGTEFLGEVKDSADTTRLIPFQFKTSDTYILEFGDQIMRVYRSGQQILTGSAKHIMSMTNANPGVFTTTDAADGSSAVNHLLSNGDEVFITVDLPDLLNRNFKIANATSTTFTLTDLFGNAVDTTSMGSFSAGETQTVDKIFEVATPYTSAQLADVNFAQSADTMFLVHPSHAIRTLTRSANNNWTFATPSLTSSSNSSILNLNVSSDNYPSVVTFFEQRLVFAGTNNNPQTIFFSKNGSYTDFTTGSNADDALVYTIASNTVNEIRWMSATRVLVIGTAGGEFVVTTSSQGPITPTTTLIRKYSNYGSAKVAPVQVADVTLFLQRNQRKVREFRYVGDVDEFGYQAPDMTILSEHITEGGITEFAYQQEPDSIVWCLRGDGVLLGMTYRREEQVVAWHKHLLGGVLGTTTVTVGSVTSSFVGKTVTLTKGDGTSVTFTADALGASSASSTLHFIPVSGASNTTATNLATAINNHDDFTATASTTTVTIKSAIGQVVTATSSDDNNLRCVSQTNAVVESIATLPSDSGEDELYMIVKRTINSATKRYIERLKSIEFGNTTEEAFFCDSALTFPSGWPTPADYSTERTTAMTGLYHLEGQVISITANGAAHAVRTVSSGDVTLSFESTLAVMGLGYNSSMQTLRLEAGSADGTSQGKPKRLHGVTVRLLNTVGLDVGPNNDTLESIPFRDSSMAASEAVPLFTGDKTVEFTGTYYENDTVHLRQTQALPLTVLAIYPRLTTFDI